MKINKYVIISASIILIWSTYPYIVEKLSNITGTKLDGSIERLNSLFSALAFAGLFITIYFQRKDYKDLSEKADVKEYMELYRFYFSSEFRETRLIAYDVLKKSLQNPEYANYILNASYISRYIDRPSNEELFRNFKHLYPNISEDKVFFESELSKGKHKLDDVINFYQLISIKNIPNHFFEICDFYYDTWRPYLYWFAFNTKEVFESNNINIMYNNPPELLSALKRLDEKLYKPYKTDVLTKENIFKHPIINGIVEKSENK